MSIEKNKIYIDDSISTSSLSRITPATKEQRDALMKAMKDAGYTFDFEKKELEKIEQNNTEEYIETKGLSELEAEAEELTKEISDEIDGNKVVIKKGNQKPIEWSEEDENMLRRVFDSLNTYAKGAYPILKSIVEEEIDWLKSLKSRNLCVYNPYKVVVESIAKMCNKYKNCMCDEEKAKDFLTNIAVKCREAAEYDKKYMEE